MQGWSERAAFADNRGIEVWATRSWRREAGDEKLATEGAVAGRVTLAGACLVHQAPPELSTAGLECSCQMSCLRQHSSPVGLWAAGVEDCSTRL